MDNLKRLFRKLDCQKNNLSNRLLELESFLDFYINNRFKSNYHIIKDHLMELKNKIKLFK